MERKQISIKLSDGKSYIFSERNMEDRDFSRYQKLVRKAKWQEIEEIESDPENQFALKMQLVNAVFNDVQISHFISGSQEEQLKICYDSFKIEHSAITFEQFKELAKDENLSRLIKVVNTLEYDEPATDDEIKLEFGLNKNKMKLLVEEYPHIYSQMQRSIKKKVRGNK